MASKFDAMYDIKGLIEDCKKSNDSDNAEFKEVPFGTYEVSVSKAELKESKTHKPMVSIWFKILTGEFKNSIIFYNQVVEQGFQLGIVYRMLSKFAGTELHFESFTQLEEILSATDDIECALEYSEGKKGFANYKIIEVFE